MTDTWPTTPEELARAYEAAVSRAGKTGAIGEMASTYEASYETARRRLIAAGLHKARKRPCKPDQDELRASYESACAEHGSRRAVRALARAYGVEYGTLHGWLVEAGLHTPKARAGTWEPITTPCPCGAEATTRYKDEDTPLCFRCYMRRYSGDPNSAFRRHGRLMVIAAKKDQPCTDCGGVFPPCVMDFDHVPERGEKLFPLGRSDRSLKTLTEEIAKCDVVCANCHRIRTQNRRAAKGNQSAS